MTRPSFLSIPKPTQAVLSHGIQQGKLTPPSLSPFFSHHVTKLQAPFGVFLNNSRTLVFLYHFFTFPPPSPRTHPFFC